ncbi:MAG TPA: aldo/keto reductase [Burkholderiaceae bacterium]|jgi:diketogulonate reductase-like aldo/keto reductase|nr:aldo/keto reductase [Burkholderiaceae bacterium]
MKTVSLPSGEQVPALGQGTWMMGERAGTRGDEIASLRLGLDLGLTLIDTAEMYGDGRAESLIGEALAGRRDEAFLVSKVYPHNASAQGMIAACERSLKRLQTDRIDLYLLHWPGQVPLSETLAAFRALQAAGKIRHYGVSNFDLSDLQAWWTLDTTRGVATNQVLYNLTRRGIEWDLQPWMRERRIPVMAYSPIEQARLISDRRLMALSHDIGHTPAQIALAWLLARDDTIALPKTGHPQRVRENAAASSIVLDGEQLARLDAMFAPPRQSTPLEML